MRPGCGHMWSLAGHGYVQRLISLSPARKCVRACLGRSAWDQRNCMLFPRSVYRRRPVRRRLELRKVNVSGASATVSHMTRIGSRREGHDLSQA
jgi:hypothetical protein